MRRINNLYRFITISLFALIFNVCAWGQLENTPQLNDNRIKIEEVSISSIDTTSYIKDYMISVNIEGKIRRLFSKNDSIGTVSFFKFVEDECSEKNNTTMYLNILLYSSSNSNDQYNISYSKGVLFNNFSMTVDCLLNADDISKYTTYVKCYNFEKKLF